jgi:hypothetical protein
MARIVQRPKRLKDPAPVKTYESTMTMLSELLSMKVADKRDVRMEGLLA